MPTHQQVFPKNQKTNNKLKSFDQLVLNNKKILIQKMNEDLSRFEKHCDIILVDEKTGQEYKMISAIICSRSEYFDALLSQEWNQNKVNRFKVRTNDAWNDIHRWIITGQANFKKNQWMNVLRFADMYVCDSLKEHIIDLLKKDNSPTFSSDDITFLCQPQYFDLLMKNHRTILLKLTHPINDPFFAFFVTIAYRDLRVDSDPFEKSSYIARCASYNYDVSSGFRIVKTKNLEMTMFPGLFVKYRNHKIECRPLSISADVYGTNELIQDKSGFSIHQLDLVKVFDKRNGSLGVNKFFGRFIFTNFDYDELFIKEFDLTGDIFVHLNSNVNPRQQ